MEKLIEKILCLNQAELDEVMQAIETWYRIAYPDWDVVYIALHKDPVLRKQELSHILDLLANEMAWREQQIKNTEA